MIRLLLIFLAFATTAHAQPAPPLKTRNVFLIMSDGLRWQEVFRGGDESLMTKDHGAENVPALKKAFLRDTPELRREALMPFLWSTVAPHGQIYGNRDLGSDAHVTNTMWFSYPGYNETLCGFADPAIDSNKKIPNQNVTVFEWLHKRPEFQGKVAAFGGWDVFPFIFNADRCGFPVDDGLAPLTQGTITPDIRVINRLRNETPPRWAGCHFDSFVFLPALKWIKANQPRLVFLCFGETDEWAHEGNYDQYLRAAHRADGYIKELWDTCQSLPQYKDTTTFIITTDHGRGDNSAGPKDWNNHGAKHPGSDQMWIAIIGPDTPALGERQNCEAVTQSQIAATVGAFFGEDWPKAEPRAAAPISAALPSR